MISSLEICSRGAGPPGTAYPVGIVRPGVSCGKQYHEPLIDQDSKEETHAEVRHPLAACLRARNRTLGRRRRARARPLLRGGVGHHRAPRGGAGEHDPGGGQVSRLLVAAAFALAPLAAGAQGQAKAPSLPDGKGRQLVESVCSACHALQLISASSGYTREHWKELTGYMIDLSGSPSQQGEILDYLAANFPPNDRRAAKLVPGKLQVSFKEWVMPQLGERTRDPIQAADGSIWYAGQFGNLIGRLDPRTGQA